MCGRGVHLPWVVHEFLPAISRWYQRVWCLLWMIEPFLRNSPRVGQDFDGYRRAWTLRQRLFSRHWTHCQSRGREANASIEDLPCDFLECLLPSNIMEPSAGKRGNGPEARDRMFVPLPSQNLTFGDCRFPEHGLIGLAHPPFGGSTFVAPCPVKQMLWCDQKVEASDDESSNDVCGGDSPEGSEIVKRAT